jgi:hypothetical protein
MTDQKIAIARRREEAAKDAPNAVAEYKAQSLKLATQTTKLKALRLAKEAADREAAATAPTPVKSKKPARSKQANSLK